MEEPIREILYLKPKAIVFKGSGPGPGHHQQIQHTIPGGDPGINDAPRSV